MSEEMKKGTQEENSAVELATLDDRAFYQWIDDAIEESFENILGKDFQKS